MEVQVDILRLAKKRVEFSVGDIVVWNDTPYLVVSLPRYCLIDMSGCYLANGTHATLDELLNYTNKMINTPEDRRNIKVYRKDEFILNLERR